MPVPSRDFSCRCRVGTTVNNEEQKSFKFIKRKTEPARDFLRKGRSGAMVLEIILAGQFFAEVFREMVLQKLPFVLCLLISTALLAEIAELLNLVVKLILGGGKRCKSYFLTSLLSVFMIKFGERFAERPPSFHEIG